MAVAGDGDLALHQPLRSLARVFIMSSSSGSTSESGWSSVSDSAWPMSFSAERFRMPTLPEASTPMMPALADDSTLDEPAATVDQVAGADQFVALGAQFLRHLVEGLAELGEIAFRFVHRHLHIQIAGGHDIGGAHSDCGIGAPTNWRNSTRSAPTPSGWVSAITQTEASAIGICQAGIQRLGIRSPSR